MTKYYYVSNIQLFTSAILVGIISAALVTINIKLTEFYEMPVVVLNSDKCTAVKSFKNGETFTCADVDVTLRNYRIKKD